MGSRRLSEDRPRLGRRVPGPEASPGDAGEETPRDEGLEQKQENLMGSPVERQAQSCSTGQDRSWSRAGRHLLNSLEGLETKGLCDEHI